MTSAIVTGANSFVGGAVVHYLLSKGVDVCAVVHNDNKGRLNDCNGLKVVSCDLSEISTLPGMLDKEYDLFYHFAWTGASGPSRADYELQLNNAKYTLDAVKTAKAAGCSKIIVSGTIMEIETIKATMTDDNRPGSAYIYGAGKTVAHMMASAIAAQVGIDLLWAQITNAYGPGELSPRLVNTTIQKCMAGVSPEFTAGTQNYDFVYIDDVAKAFYDIGMFGKPFRSYLIGSSSAKPLKEFLMEMKDSIAPDLPFVFGNVPFTGVNLPLESFSTKRTEDDTGFRAQVPFGEGCRRTRDWLKER